MKNKELIDAYKRLLQLEFPEDEVHQIVDYEDEILRRMGGLKLSPLQESLCGIAGSAHTSINTAIHPIAKTAEHSEVHHLPDAEWNSLSKESQQKLNKWFELATKYLQAILDEPLKQETQPCRMKIIEDCCKAVCGNCRRGDYPERFYAGTEGGWHHTMLGFDDRTEPCSATPIREYAMSMVASSSPLETPTVSNSMTEIRPGVWQGRASKRKVDTARLKEIVENFTRCPSQSEKKWDKKELQRLRELCIADGLQDAWDAAYWLGQQTK